jgi:5'-nucleotidase
LEPVALVSNDDGIGSLGLRALVGSLRSRGFRVYVVAPRGPMSGTSKSFKMPARFGESIVEGARGAWWVDSTPATAVYVALKRLLPERPDVVVSGVNKGPNMGLEDFFTSGTIGAAIEGALQGIHSIAVSLAVDDEGDMEDYRVAAEIAAGVASVVARRKPSSFNLVNINVPRGPPRGVLITRLAFNNYEIEVDVSGDERLVAKRDSISERYWDRRPGTDVWAVMRGYTAITPINLNQLVEAINSGLDRGEFSYLVNAAREALQA